MDAYERHRRIWRFFYVLLRGPICRLFCLEHEDPEINGPCLIVANHVTDWDPLLLAMSFPRLPLYYVASEHIFRQGLISRVLLWLMEPIARRKGAAGTDTVKACLRHLKDGHAVCLFAEGDATWDGRTAQVFPATGKLARSSGAWFLTYRLEGAYLSKPRWGRGIRRGSVSGHPVKLYSPEELRAMKAEEITAAINRDLYEDAWERQRENPVSFRSRHPAEKLETALFLCPKCKRFGTLQSHKSILTCDCGLWLRVLDTGFFDPPEPFSTVAQWEDWQQGVLADTDFPEGKEIFRDSNLELYRVSTDHKDRFLAKGALVLFPECLCLDAHRFPLERISTMAMVQRRRLLLTCDNEYYELRTTKDINLRKYLSYWNTHKRKGR